MKLVIDIHDNVYELVKQFEKELEFIDEQDDTVGAALMRAVINGTPIPEHHGKLISEKDVLSVILFSKLFDSAKVGEVKEVLSNIPTIIEADKER